MDPETGKSQKVIFVDDEMFDWGIEETDIQSAVRAARGNPAVAEALHSDIQQHLLDSLSEFIGKEVTFKDIINAQKDGYIEI